MTIRELTKTEVDRVWEIDRAEVVNKIYYHEDGRLVLKPEHYDIPGWPHGESEEYGPLLHDCFDRGGTFYGAFDGDELMGAAVLENKFIGRDRDQLQLEFLHVSRRYRKGGLGRALFEKAAGRAQELGAKWLYVSATPSENTIHFYFHMGCSLTEELNPELFALEPEDIHLEYRVPE